MNSAGNSGVDRFIPAWTEDKRFAHGNAVAIVKRSNHHTPRYSYEVAFVVSDRLSRYCTVRAVSGDSVKVEVERSDVAVAAVLGQALDYIRDMIQEQAIDAKIEKERTAIDRSRPAVKPGLKTLAKIDKQRREGV